MKYAVIEFEGCVSGRIEVNGKTIGDLTPDELNHFENYVLVQIKEGLKDGTVQLSSVLGCLQYDEVEHDEGLCEQCGDSTSRTIWRI